MINSSKSLKTKVSHLSEKTNIPNKYLIQNFLFEALIKRISISKYKEKFIIKGGFLLTSIFGVNLRSTMDLDTTIKGIHLNEENIRSIIKEIIDININDNITFEIENIKEIREDSNYEGYNINLKTNFDGIITNLMIDVTSGDVITYSEVEYKYKTLFDNEIIEIMAYNNETIIAEKYNSIISKNIINTRMKDYYDIYMFINYEWPTIDKKTLKDALHNTFKSRNTLNYLKQSSKYLDLIKNNNNIKKLWNNYKTNYIYASEISFEELIKTLTIINEILNENK